MMKKGILFFMSCCLALQLAAQKERTLLTIDNVPVSVSEFRRVYEKNLDLVEDEDSKDLDAYLKLYINYKLKVKAAYDKGLDTSRAYKRELETYKNQLSAPYLQDKSFINQLIKDAYYRTKNEVRASHILVMLPPQVYGKDTLRFYNRILKARQRILAGESFEKVAKEISEDPSVKKNSGDLGYFSAFKMVYPFEDAAYKTKKGKVSMPFKTRFGYHLVKVTAQRVSKGEIDAAHILITDTTAVGKKRIDEIYAKLNQGAQFDVLAKTYSNDKGSAGKGGRLPRFGSGRMVADFETAAFAIAKEGTYSKPIRTKFGWHIIKLLKKHPVGSFETMKAEITNRVKSSGRMRLSDDAVIQKLKKKYTIKVDDKALQLFQNSPRRIFPKDSMQDVLLSINEKQLTQEDFSNYIRNRRHRQVPDLLQMFTDEEIKNYFKENLVHTEPDYKYTLQEYQDGLLLFELMQQKIWNKAAKDSIGLQRYFTEHKSKYNTSELKQIRGEVISDYQQHLEKEWLQQLRKKSKIKINKRQFRRLKKYYQKKGE